MSRFRYKIVKVSNKYEEYYEVYERLLGFLWWVQWKDWRCGTYTEALHCIQSARITYEEGGEE